GGDCINAGQRQAAHASRLVAQHVPFSGLLQAHTPGERRAFAPATMEATGENRLAAGGSRIRTLGPPLGEYANMRSRAKIGKSQSSTTAAWRGLVRPVHQLPGRSAILRNLTAGCSAPSRARPWP